MERNDFVYYLNVDLSKHMYLCCLWSNYLDIGGGMNIITDGCMQFHSLFVKKEIEVLSINIRPRRLLNLACLAIHWVCGEHIWAQSREAFL